MTAPIKVLRVITRLNVGGPAQHVAYLAAGLNAHGFETVLVSGRIDPGEGDMEYFCAKLGVPVRYVDSLTRPISILKDILALIQMIKIIWKEKPDILHTHLAKAGFVGRMAARLLRPFGVNPVMIHTYHGHIFHGYFSEGRNFLHTFLERLCGRWTDRIVLVSKKLLPDMVHLYEIAPEKKFRVIPLGFDLKPFLNTPRRTGIFRKRIRADDRTPLIGIVGRLTGVKDHILFLDAFLLVLKQIPAATAVVVGDGGEKERIQTHAEKLGIASRVLWAGFLKDLSGVYSDLDVLALTSKNEGTPVAVIEAQAAGCPVVAADVGGTADAMPAPDDHDVGALAPGKQLADDRFERLGGFLVRRRTPENFAWCLVEILQGRLKLKDSVRMRISEKFNVERLCEDVAHLYKNTLTACRPMP